MPKDLTLHQQRVLAEWESPEKPTHAQIAAKFRTSRSAITETLQEARLRKYGQALARGGRKITFRPMQLSFAVNI